jgi:hypothetical protein
MIILCDTNILVDQVAAEAQDGPTLPRCTR